MADLHAQYESLQDEIDTVLKDVLRSCRFILGPNVSALESEIAEYCEAKHAVGVASGTDAIALALSACGVGQGDEVITTPFTFVATTETIVQIGAVPVYVDIDPATFNLDPAQVEGKITSKTKAVVPVHLYGQTADLTELENICRKHNLTLVSDGAQAIGAKHKGKGIGAYGTAGTLSFFPTKNLGAYGDGGMVITNDDAVAEKVRSLRFHGSGGSYSYNYVGWCSRLDEIQAAILRVKLRKLDSWNHIRTEHARTYLDGLADTGLCLPMAVEDNVHVWHQFTVRSEHRDDLQAYLKSRDIASAVYYPGALHTQPAYRKFGYAEGDFPEAEKACLQVLSLPVYPELPAESVKRVVAAVKQFHSSLVTA